jgi:2-polyprenyl-3-methyl-5-hydroxy-6-metoxy-1,4-benzoquinol methylase
MSLAESYAPKHPSYFENARSHIEPLLPAQCSDVLEVGCGAGATIRWLRTCRSVRRVCAIEISPAAGALARDTVDELLIGNAEELVGTAFEGRRFDLILCLDVVEHMVDPWAFCATVAQRLKAGGTIVFSIPNVRNVKVVLPLIFGGRWRYEDDGLLDRTHLRFFTRRSALELVQGAGLTVSGVERFMPVPRTKLRLMHLMTLGLLPDLFAITYLIGAQAPSTAAG